MDRKNKKIVEKHREKGRVDPDGGNLIDSSDGDEDWGFNLSGNQECL